MGLRKTIMETNYRLKLRKGLGNETNECIKITYEEVVREMKRRKMKL